jgi:dynein heavy chain
MQRLRFATCFCLMQVCTAALQGVFGPPGGKHLIAFIDDLNMPQKSKFGFIPPLELLKLWVDYGFWYDRQRCEAKQIKDMQLMAAMAPPGGGRNAFSQRLQVSNSKSALLFCNGP